MDTTLKSFERMEQRAKQLRLRYKKHRPKLWKRRVYGQPIVHRYKKAVNIFSRMVEEGKLYNAFEDSDLSDLAIVTVHNYDERSLFEQSLDFLGVEDYSVLKHSGEWKHAYKFTYLLEFLEECKKPYILFCDARDTVFTDDPAKVVPLFKEFNCEGVFNATISNRGIFSGIYRPHKRWAADLYWWTMKMSSGRKRFPNAGAFIGKAKFVKEISEVIAFYCESMGCASPPNSDQDVLRAIYPWFWPRMSLDHDNEIFYRN